MRLNRNKPGNQIEELWLASRVLLRPLRFFRRTPMAVERASIGFRSEEIPRLAMPVQAAQHPVAP